MGRKARAVIVDIDGTITDCSHRLKYIESKPADWDRFFAEAKNDAPNMGVIRWVRALWASGLFVFLVSGRRRDTLEDTREWMRRHWVPYQRIYMPRKPGDYRPDTVIKEAVGLEIREKHHVLCCIDDRPSVCEMWRKLGFKVFPVHQERWEHVPKERT